MKKNFPVSFVLKKKYKLFFLSLLLLTCYLQGCAFFKPKSEGYVLLNQETFLLKKKSKKSDYGYSASNPIKVGGKDKEGVLNEKRFLNALLSPSGKPITYTRMGSCCPFPTPNALFGKEGLLDIYEIRYQGLKKPITLYLNFYDYEKLYIPKGFTSKKK
ncbi:hypothetical protein [Hugenholtzia roseola]|uniref:hypothetical protein n=1 Tax=Hugenholtzia roseola TaxID=1002 RepID=UPI000406D268|nr:hypothetical protein [Hugenholtzia roseola]